LNYDIGSVAERFRIDGDFVLAESFGSGHINDTFAATFERDGSRTRYIIQRINRNVFKAIPEMMENIERVTAHVRAKLVSQGTDDIARRVLSLVPARSGSNIYRDTDGNSWRAYRFIERARTYDVARSPDLAFEAARAYGSFQSMLADLPDPPLHETIPGFHDGPKRLNDFMQALDADAHNRAKEVRAEIDFLMKHAPIFDVLPKQAAEGKIPVRATHNDTKINNVLIDDETKDGICVIDLDTLMPGLSLYDFGDMVRTATCSAAEDERDLAKVTLRMSFFEEIVRGYLSTAGEFLTRIEREHLVLAGKMITLIIGTRFLTDYLSGDVYFRILRKGHNLDRCRIQFRLVESIASREEEMRSFVEQMG